MRLFVPSTGWFRGTTVEIDGEQRLVTPLAIRGFTIPHGAWIGVDEFGHVTVSLRAPWQLGETTFPTGTLLRFYPYPPGLLYRLLALIVAVLRPWRLRHLGTGIWFVLVWPYEIVAARLQPRIDIATPDGEHHLYAPDGPRNP